MARLILFSFVLVWCGLTGFHPAPPKDTRPNIILILADDMGYSDIGCYGGEIATPNIDYLAANGLRFTQFYNNSRCCPTRASLLTGIYSHDAGIGNMSNDQHQPGYQGHLLDNTVTLAEMLKAAGYHTGMAGKWHVSNTLVQPTPEAQLKWLDHQEEHPLFSPLEQYPTNRGFEKFYGTLWGVVDYFDPFSLVSGTEPVTHLPPNYYHTDAINDSAASFIRQFSRDDQPFFLYVAENAPHWPVQALPEDIKKYKDTYTKGWEAIRQERYRRMIRKGIIDPATHPLPPMEHDTQWAKNPNKEYDARAMAVHAAMIDRMDQGIGRIIKALRESGRLENTIIVFLSDNGASPELCANFGPGFDRPAETRDGRKIIYPADKRTLPGPETVYGSIGPVWANVSNTPYRYWKIESYEGGMRTPMVVYWPKGMRAPKGSLTAQLGHVMDFMPTFAMLAKTQYPTRSHGHLTPTMDGSSLLAILQGNQREGYNLLFNEHNNRRYLRSGDWKIVSTNTDTTWHLYNLRDDATETKDLAAKYPDRVSQMNHDWQELAREHHVYPKPSK